MPRRLIIPGTLFLALTGFLVWWFSDSQVVKRQSKAFAQSMSIDVADGKTARMNKNQDFRQLLSPSASCSVKLDSYTSDFRHDDLIAAHHMLVHNCRSSMVKINQLEITSLTENRATVEASLDLSVTETGGTRHDESCHATLIWEKNDISKWQLSAISIQR